LFDLYINFCNIYLFFIKKMNINSFFSSHINLKFLCVGFILSILSLIRFGFAVNIGNDNEFIIPFLINVHPLESINEDLIFQSGYSNRTIFFDFLKIIFINFNTLYSSFFVYLFFLNSWFFVWHHIYISLNIKSFFAYLFFIILISSPYLFTYSGPVLYDQYLTPRFLSLLVISIALLLYLKKRLYLSSLMIGFGLIFHIPTALPAVVLFMLNEIINRKISKKSLYCVFLFAIPLSIFYYINFENLNKEFYLFNASSIWFSEIENRIPYLFFKNFNTEQIIIIIGWFILIPAFIFKFFKNKYGAFSYLLFLPILYLIIGQISIDFFKFPVAMVLQSSKFVNIYLIPLSLLLLIFLDNKSMTVFNWLLIILLLIYRSEFLPYVIFFIIIFKDYLNFKLTYIYKVIIIVFSLFSSFSINMNLYNSSFLNYLFTGWMHPHYGLRIEPFIWRTKIFIGDIEMWQSPQYSNDRIHLLNFIKDNIKINDLILVSGSTIDDFYDFRSRTNRGLYWDNKSGGAMYYSTDKFVKEWTNRQYVNSMFSRIFESKNCNNIDNELLKELKDKNVYWYLVNNKVDCANDLLSLERRFSSHYLYRINY
tara:strand:+ start:1567 stop:3348 length:1782 start_codon:yes stop_codon:yes gene_type:complete